MVKPLVQLRSRRYAFGAFLSARLQHMERVLAGREWLASTFSVACASSIASRGLAGHPACRDYVARATARPAFTKALADQMAHFAAAD
jgi:glutathione S-transferase